LIDEAGARAWFLNQDPIGRQLRQLGKPGEAPKNNPDLEMAKPPPPAVKAPEKFPDMPWKKKPSDSGH
jgi:hypothetical protein